MSFRRLSSTTGVVLATLLLALEAFVPAAARADACPNAAERFGASANLPDCRAYELVTPMVKEDNSLLFDMYGFSDGGHVVFSTFLPLPGAKNGEPGSALSARTESGWVTTSLTSPQGPGELDNLFRADTGNNPVRASYTSDFSAAFVNSTYASDPLDQNLVSDVYRVNIPGGSSSLASLPDTGAMTEGLYHPPGIEVGEEPGSYIAGNSADGSRVFFTTLGRVPTAPGTPADTRKGGAYETYERYAGHTYLVGILPDGSVAPCGAEVGNGGETGTDYYALIRYGAVSPDGSNVVFHTFAQGLGNPECPVDFLENHSLGGVYLRENNGTLAAKTVRLPGELFLARTADGSKIFTTGEKELYEYDIPTGQTTMLGENAALVASSADGSRVYYIDHPGREQQLKVYDNGVTKTIPNAGPAYAGGYYYQNEIIQSGYLSLAVATPDGSKLLFLDRANLTSYNANGPECIKIHPGIGPDEKNCGEAYIYNLTTGSFTCVSCNPSGAPPLSDVVLYSAAPSNSFLPQTTPLLSEDGSRAFFQTTEALVPQDTNGEKDVYEWENGHIYLLSSGQGGTPGKQELGGRDLNEGVFGIAGSQLIGVSSNGNDVFIATDDRLLPQDIENSGQIYDVRVGGGFPYTPPVYGCDSGQCQGPQTPAPIFAPPPSATFVGVGNPVREEAKPVPKPAKHKAKRKAKKALGKGRSGKGKGKGRK